MPVVSLTSMEASVDRRIDDAIAEEMVVVVYKAEVVHCLLALIEAYTAVSAS